MTTRHRRVSGRPNVPGHLGGEDWDDTHVSTALHGSGTPLNGSPMNFGFFVDTSPFVADGGTFRLVVEGVPTAYFDINATSEDVVAALEALPSIGVGNVVASGSGATLATVGEMDFQLAGPLVRTTLDLDVETTITPSLIVYLDPSDGTLGDTGEYYIDDANNNVWRNIGTYLDANWWPETNVLIGTAGRRLGESRVGDTWSMEQYSPAIGYNETYRLSLDRFDGARVLFESSDGLARHLALRHDAAVLDASAPGGGSAVNLNDGSAGMSTYNDAGYTGGVVTAPGIVGLGATQPDGIQSQVQVQPTAVLSQIRNAALDVIAGLLVSELGIFITAGLPTVDPHAVGQLWNSSGTMKISAG